VWKGETIKIKIKKINTKYRNGPPWPKFVNGYDDDDNTK
jgi:hypothetical protein